jgi:thiol-disulfide isomerase/thioredoxin
MRITLTKIINLILVLTVVASALYLPGYMKKRDERIRQEQKQSLFHGRPVVLEFTSVDCEICKKIKPIMAKLKKEYQGKLDFVAVQVESAEGKQLMKTYPVEYYPSFYLLYSPDKLFAHFEGGYPEETLRQGFDQFLSEQHRSQPKNSGAGK